MESKDMRIEWMETEALEPYEKNAKAHPERQVEMIANSINEFGFRQPIVVDGNGLVIIGHGRLLAAKRLGMERVPCMRADDLSEAQVKALRLADNKLNESEWIAPLRDEELAELAGEIDMSMFGFEEALEEMAEAVNAREDDFDPDEPVEPKAKRGDIYQLGEHRLMCGDSTDPDDVDKLLDGAEIDLLMTDPPYNCNVGSCERPHSSNDGVHILNDSMPESEFIPFLTSALWNAERSMRGGCSVLHMVCRAASYRV